MLLRPGPVIPVKRSRFTYRSTISGYRIPISGSIDYMVRDTPRRGPGDTVCKFFERAKTALHTRINEEINTKDENRFSALEGRLDKFLEFSGEVEQLVTFSKDIRTLRGDVNTILEEHSTWVNLTAGAKVVQETNSCTKMVRASKKSSNRTTSATVIVVDEI